MSVGPRLPIAEARRVAEALAARWLPHCERLLIAGSIRRECETVGDLEFVVIPKFGSRMITRPGDLFPSAERNLMLAQIVEDAQSVEFPMPIKPGTKDIIPWTLASEGKYWRLWDRARSLKVDVFVCDRETWGLNVVIRTGSGVGPDGRPETGFGPAMLARWKRISGGGKSEGARLVDVTGAIYSTPEEADVFRVLCMPFVEPRDRVSSAAVPRDMP